MTAAVCCCSSSSLTGGCGEGLCYYPLQPSVCLVFLSVTVLMSPAHCGVQNWLFFFHQLVKSLGVVCKAGSSDIYKSAIHQCSLPELRQVDGVVWTLLKSTIISKLSDHLLHRNSACKAKICQRGKGDGLHWMLKWSLRRRKVEVQLRLFQAQGVHSDTVVTGQSLKVEGNATDSQIVRSRRCTNKSNVHLCLTKTTAFMNSMSKLKCRHAHSLH